MRSHDKTWTNLAYKCAHFKTKNEARERGWLFWWKILELKVFHDMRRFQEIRDEFWETIKICWIIKDLYWNFLNLTQQIIGWAWKFMMYNGSWISNNFKLSLYVVSKIFLTVYFMYNATLSNFFLPKLPKPLSSFSKMISFPHWIIYVCQQFRWNVKLSKHFYSLKEKKNFSISISTENSSITWKNQQCQRGIYTRKNFNQGKN